MSFVTSKQHQQHYNNNRTEFISPPVTPKEQLESTFNSSRIITDEDCWDSSASSTEESSIAPSSPPSSCSSPIMAISSIIHTSKEKKKTHPIAPSSSTTMPSYRRKQKPIQSLPRSTKGTFCMPSFIDDMNNKMQLSSQQPTSSRNNNTTTASITIRARKRKQQPGNGCATTTVTTEKNSLLATKNNDHNCNDNKAIIEQATHNIPLDNNNKEIISSTLLSSPNQIEEECNNTVTENDEDNPQVSKKAKTNAAYLYDNLSAGFDQADVFLNSEEWIPKLDVFDRRPTVRISWKGSPLKIRNMPYFEKLHAGEVTIAATLRLTPEQYLKCKWALVLAAKEAHDNNAMFRKSEAQKVCCIDVNKTSVLWNAFGKLGWLGSKWPQ